MGLLGHAPEPDDIALVVADTPAPDPVDGPAVGTLRCPMVDIGRWNCDEYKRLERVYGPDLFSDLPLLLADIAAGIPAKGPDVGRPTSSTLRAADKGWKPVGRDGQAADRRSPGIDIACP